MAVTGICGFGQTSALRDYVGMISQVFHPDVVSFIEGLKAEHVKQGNSVQVKNIDTFLKGDSGTGFVYVAPDGSNYIITNYHVISQAVTLTITFEKQDGEKSKFSELTIVAVDEEMDIALLAFAGGQKPFKEGLRFLSRPVQEGDDVYSAGFPGLGASMIWQLGRGMISNASVRLPSDDDEEKMLGPFIQHTAQVDPGNSGGPLLVQVQGVPTGFAVAGINTLKALRRQAANYAIPLNRLQSFLDASFKPPAEDQRPLLDERVTAFTAGLGEPKAVYAHIAKFLSNDCIGENGEYALSELLLKAPLSVRKDIFDRQIITCMTYAVAWTIENNIRSKMGKLAIEVDSVAPNDTGGFTVAFRINDKIVPSEWMNEYGIWRIKSFGDFITGDKTLVEKRAKTRAAEKKLRANPPVQISAGYANVLDRGGAFGLDLVVRSNYFGYGFRTYIGKGFFEIDSFVGAYIPIKLGGKAALVPFATVGLGGQFKDAKYRTYDSLGGTTSADKEFMIGIPVQAGLSIITAAVPGLYFQFAYQNNDIFLGSEKEKDPHMLFFSIGYAF
jgi:serine protease Do